VTRDMCDMIWENRLDWSSSLSCLGYAYMVQLVVFKMFNNVDNISSLLDVVEHVPRLSADRLATGVRILT